MLPLEGSAWAICAISMSEERLNKIDSTNQQTKTQEEQNVTNKQLQETNKWKKPTNE